MSFQWSTFDFRDSLTEDDLDYFEELLVFDSYGEVEGRRQIDYMSESVERVKNKNLEPLRKTDGLLSKYSYAIKRNKERKKNKDALRTLNMVDEVGSEKEFTKLPYGSINSNMIVVGDEDSLFKTVSTVDGLDSMLSRLEDYRVARIELMKLEGVDLNVTIMRALENVPKALNLLKEITSRHTYMKPIIEDVLKLRELDYMLVPELAEQ